MKNVLMFAMPTRALRLVMGSALFLGAGCFRSVSASDDAGLVARTDATPADRPTPACVDLPASPAGPRVPFGALEADCTPDHRQAWAMLLGSTTDFGVCGFDGTVDTYRVYVAPPGPITAATRWTVGTGGVEAYVVPALLRDAWVPVRCGAVRFDRYEEGRLAIGAWGFRLDDGREVTGTFDIGCFGATRPPTCR